jgi:hypothetical protein
LINTNHPDNTAHGGVAIYVKSSLTYQPLLGFSQDLCQSCSIQIKLNYTFFTIAAIYSLPPKHNIITFKFTEFFNTIKNNFIVGGDFNVKHQSWGCRTGNPRGTTLHNFINLKKYKVLSPPAPTYWPSSLKKKNRKYLIFSSLNNPIHFIATQLISLI